MTNAPNSLKPKVGVSPRMKRQPRLFGSERFDVVVIGAGQAGLALGHFLARQGRRFVIVEAGDSVGSAWRGRWDSLALFTPRRYDGPPGSSSPATPTGTPPATR